MKAFVFAPSNRLIGKFEVTLESEVPKAVEAFAEGRLDIPAYSYVECGKAKWTIMSVSPIVMSEGKVEKAPIVIPKAERYHKSVVSQGVFLTSLVVVVLSGAGGIAFVGSLACAAFTIIDWLRTGVWSPVETAFVLENFPDIARWIAAPGGWYGLHKVATFLAPMPWSFLISIALFMVVFMVGILDPEL